MPIQAELYSLVDVGLEPELKGKFLRGRVNYARCENCGSEGIIAAPIMYHDPEKELLLVFIPPESQLSDQEQQQIIGRLTNLIMGYLPPENRKAYLLLPKVFLSYQSLIETVLQSEGITPEMLEAQRVRLGLVDRLWQAMPNAEDFSAQVAEVDSQLDFEFFATLGAYIESVRQDGREDRVRSLEALRETLLEKSTYGRRLAAQALSGRPGPPPLDRPGLLQRLLEASSEAEMADLVSAYRSSVDYAFFQMLTERLQEAAQAGRSDEAARLQEMRESLLRVTQRLDEETRAALERAAGLLRQLMAAPEAEAFVREHMDEFDDAFFIVLGANLQAAQAAGKEDVHLRLVERATLVLEVAQENLPPQVRLVQTLLNAPDDEVVRSLLAEHSTLVHEDFLSLLEELAEETEDDREELAGRLRHLAELTERWLEENAGPS